MKNNLIISTLIVGTLFVANVSISQKKNETSAAVAFKNTYSSAIENGNLPSAKKALLDAKKYIDLAADNEETKNSPKTLLLKGNIYTTLFLLGNDSQDTSILNALGVNPMESAISSFKTGYNVSDKKYKDEIKESVIEKHHTFENSAITSYNNTKYEEAAGLYLTSVKFYDAINIIDTNSLYNSGLCYDKANNHGDAAMTFEKVAKLGFKGALPYALASGAYRRNKQFNEAKAIIALGRIKFPQDKDILLEAVNSCLELNDAAGAETLLSEAISKDPKNKLLHLTIGSIYIDLKQNEKAEAAINNALAIDGEYEDALYQLGAHLVTWAGSIIAQTNDLKYNDPKMKVLEKQAMEIYNRAITPLERYIVKVPNDKNVLTILSQIYRSIGNMEKSNFYKEKVKALK